MRPSRACRVDGRGTSPGPAAPPPATPTGPPIVDVTLRMQEGKQYFVNRITFVGNTTTRDNVIRREMRLVESGVFNTEALKFSVKRLNQLGYFKPLEGEAISAREDAGRRQQGRRQAEVRRAEPEPADVWRRCVAVRRLLRAARRSRRRTSSAAARPSRSRRSRAAARPTTSSRSREPFLFDKPQTAGVDLFIRELQYIGLYTQKSQGGNVVYGFQVPDFARMFVNYSYEDVQIKDLNPPFNGSAGPPEQSAARRFAADGGRRQADDQQDRAELRLQHGRQPDLPDRRQAVHACRSTWPGLGGNTKFMQPARRGDLVLQAARRARPRSGFRGRLSTSGPTAIRVALPIFQKIFLGGEYSIRGFDLRSVSPRDPISGVQVGGNKSLLFNAEYLISIAGPVRLVLFYDAGQVRDVGEPFAWKEHVDRAGAAGHPGPVAGGSDDFGTLDAIR